MTLQQTTAELVQAVLAGDSRAFETLYTGHVGAVYRAIEEHVRDREQVADLVQEVFARALEALPALRDPERFRPWLLAIARHTAVDAQRTARRTELLDGEDYAVAIGGDDPEEHARLKELADLVHASVIGLSRRDAVAVALVTLGFNVADVATALQVTHGNAKVLLHRARRRLRSALVLQMLVKSKGAGCSTFEELRRNGDLSVVGRHVERCDSCIDRAKSDV